MLHSTFSGYYKLIVTNLNGNKCETDWFDNLITNTGLDLLANGFSPRIWVGTGNTTPTFTDTTLSGTILGSTTNGTGSPSSTDVNNTVLPYYSYYIMTSTFNVGAIIGTIKEVGIGVGTESTITNLFSRVLINNGNGISLTSADQLQVVYQLRRYIPQNDVNFTLNVNGIDLNCIARPNYINSYWTPSLVEGIGIYRDNCSAYTGVFSSNIFNTHPTGTEKRATSGANLTYNNGTYERYFWLEWSPASGSFTTTIVRISGAGWSLWASPRYQFSIDPGIAKTNLQTLRIEGKFTWGRYS